MVFGYNVAVVLKYATHIVQNNGNSLEFFILDGVWHSLIRPNPVPSPILRSLKIFTRQIRLITKHCEPCLLTEEVTWAGVFGAWRQIVFFVLGGMCIRDFCHFRGQKTICSSIKLCHTPSKIKNSKEFPFFLLISFL